MRTLPRAKPSREGRRRAPPPPRGAAEAMAETDLAASTTPATTKARVAQGKVVCETCGCTSVGDDFQYAKPWRENASSAECNPGCLPMKKRRPRTVCAQGNHEDFSHNKTLAHAFDFDVPCGTEVLAARGGTVVDTADFFRRGGPDPKLKSRGNFVVIRHDDDGTYGRYFHLQARSVKVRRGQRVAQGDLLAKSGATGFVGGPHLHFDVTDLYIRETSQLRWLAGAETANSLPSRLLRGKMSFDISDAGDLNIASGFATFSARMNAEARVQGPCVMADPPTVPLGIVLKNAATIRGSVACCRRGGDSSFLEKALALQAAGASAVVIIDSDATTRSVLPLIGTDRPGQDPCTIPVVNVSHESGALLDAALAKAHVSGIAIDLEVSRHPHLISSASKLAQDPSLPLVKPMTQPLVFAAGVLQ